MDNRVAVAVDSVLPQLVEAFQAVEQTDGSVAALWRLAGQINRAVQPLGRNLRHFTELEGRWLAFPLCRGRRGFLGYTNSWMVRQGRSKVIRQDLVGAVDVLVEALECAVAGEAVDPAQRFLDALYAVGDASPAGDEVVLLDHALVSLTQVGPDSVKLSYLYLDPAARGQGLGHKVLGLLERLADQHCVDLWLMAQSFRLPDQYSRDLDTDEGKNLVATEQLVKLYQQHGFRGPSKKMLREPRCQARHAAWRWARRSTCPLY
jgi:GNAT superfamily N-acetyltransferase